MPAQALRHLPLAPLLLSDSLYSSFSPPNSSSSPTFSYITHFPLSLWLHIHWHFHNLLHWRPFALTWGSHTSFEPSGCVWAKTPLRTLSMLPNVLNTSETLEFFLYHNCATRTGRGTTPSVPLKQSPKAWRTCQGWNACPHLTTGRQRAAGQGLSFKPKESTVLWESIRKVFCLLPSADSDKAKWQGLFPGRLTSAVSPSSSTPKLLTEPQPEIAPDFPFRADESVDDFRVTWWDSCPRLLPVKHGPAP